MNTDTFFGGGADDSLFGEEAAASGLERSEPGETQTASRFEPGPILPSPLLHSLAAKVELPEGQTVVHVTVTPGETVELPFAADAQFLVRLGDGNLAIKVGDVTIILEGYADASGDPEHPVVIHSADGAPLDIAAQLAATDPSIDIETAAGPGDPGGPGTDNTGAIFQQLGDQGDADGTPGAAGAQGDSTGPDGGDQGDAGGDPNPAQVQNELGPVNAAPETSDAATAGLEDAVSIAVPLSGLDSDGFVALFAITSLPTGGALYADAALTVLLAIDDTVPAVAGAATVYFVPDPNFNGAPTFQYAAIDNGGLQDTTPATATITVTPVNDVPSSINDGAAVDEGGTTTIAVLNNDTDAEGDPLTVTVVTGPAHGTVVVNSDGTISYTHDGSETTVDSFTYKVNDGTVDGNIATVSITVNPVNDAPIAVADSVTIAEGGTATVLVGGATSVLSNDTDAENNTLAAVLVSGPANGSLLLNSDGTFSYTHNGSETTSDSFTYKANDGTASGAPTTVTITITPVNDLPIAQADAVSVAEGGTATILTGGAASVLANDTDPEGTALSAILVSAPANGVLTLNADGTFSYTHNGSETTADSFTYKVNDGTVDGNTVTVTINITPVNDSPITNPDAYAVDEGGTLTVTPANKITLNDTDAESDPLSAVLVSGPLHGTLTLNADGTFSYTHNGSETGSDSFTYKANDGTSSGNPTTVTITINPVNDLPVAQADAVSVAEGGTATILAGGAASVLANDSDPEGTALSAILVSAPANGTLTLNADGTFSYTHNGSETTSDSFTYKVNDGTADGNAVTVTINITPVNDAPVTNPDAYAVDEGGTLTVTAGNKVTLNDTDVENDPLTAVLVSGPANGTLNLNADGTFTYIHDGSATTSDSFTYRANDGTANGNVATVQITVNPVNDPPIAVADSITVAEGGTATVLVGSASSILSNDTDADNDTLTAVLVTAPTNGTLTLNADGTFSYTHNGSETTTDSFTYKANDGTASGNPTTVTITITPVNDAPVANSDGYAVDEDQSLTATLGNGILLNDTDAEANALTVSLVSNVSHGTLTLNANGTFTYTPVADYHGTDSFTYKANDGLANSNLATVTITVNPMNDAPAAANDSYTTDEDTALKLPAPGILADDFDVDGDSLHVAAIVTGPSHGALTQMPDGSFTYTPNADYNGTDSFTYKANDGTADGNIATVTITVNPMNDAPAAANDSYTTDEDTALKLPAPGILANDFDVDGDSLHVAAIVTGPSHGALTQMPDGSFTYTPNADYNGTDSFTYKSNDGTASSNVATVTITVNPVDDAPVANGDSFIGTQGERLDGDVLSNDTDADLPNDMLVALLVDAPAHGTLSFDFYGRFNYYHDGGSDLTDSFTYRVADQAGHYSNIATVNIVITPANHAPVANGDSVIVVRGATTTMLANYAPSVLSNDSDPDGNSLTAILVQGPIHGSLTLNSDGTLSYTHDGTANLSDSFTYKANDGKADSNTATVNITVEQPNFFTPMAVNDSIALAQGGTTATLTTGAASVLANDTDMDTFSVLTATQLTPVLHGTLTFNTDGTFSYTHDGTAAATDSFTYWVSDGIHTSMPAVVNIAIAIPPVDPGPTANADRVFTNLGSTPFQIPEWALLYNDLGKDATQLDVTAVSGFGFNPPVHTPGIGSAGYVTFTGDALFGGGTFTYAAIEGGVTGNTANVTVQNMPFGAISGTAGQDILIGSAAGDILNGNGAIGAKGDLIFAGDGNDSIFFHAQGPFGQTGTADVVDGGSDTVVKNGGLMAGLGGDVLAITELTVDFTDGFKLSGIEGITTNNGGMPVPHSVTLNASNVVDMSDHSIAPGGVFSSQHAIYINAGALDTLYLSVSDGGKWSDTGQFATDGVSKIYVHDTTIGTAGNSENAYVIVAPTTGTVHLNQDP